MRFQSESPGKFSEISVELIFGLQIQCFKLWESAIMDQSMTFRKRVYLKDSEGRQTMFEDFSLAASIEIHEMVLSDLREKIFIRA